MIRNFTKAKMHFKGSSHGGLGDSEWYDVWNKGDFISNVDFFCRGIIPPGCSVGYHKHGNDEEMYIVLNGQGTMTLDGKEFSVSKGDMILNPPGGEHGLVNDSDNDIEVLIIQISL